MVPADRFPPPAQSHLQYEDAFRPDSWGARPCTTPQPQGPSPRCTNATGCDGGPRARYRDSGALSHRATGHNPRRRSSSSRGGLNRPRDCRRWCDSTYAVVRSLSGPGKPGCLPEGVATAADVVGASGSMCSGHGSLSDMGATLPGDTGWAPCPQGKFGEGQRLELALGSKRSPSTR